MSSHLLSGPYVRVVLAMLLHETRHAVGVRDTAEVEVRGSFKFDVGARSYVYFRGEKKYVEGGKLKLRHDVHGHSSLVIARRDNMSRADGELVYFATSDMCGADLFSQPALNCKQMSQKEMRPYTRLLGPEPAFKDRGFGVELELVARRPEASSDESASRKAQRCYQDHKNARVDSKIWGCRAHVYCQPGEYCRKVDGKDQEEKDEERNSVCSARDGCRPEESVDGRCPVEPSTWTWEDDSTVQLLTPEYRREARGRHDEEEGVGFELVSPILVGKDGVQSVVESLATLRHMGVQAGPTQGMHVHVNVGKRDVAGGVLTKWQIWNVWMNYARYQVVINDMLQDSRSSPCGEGYGWARPLTPFVNLGIQLQDVSSCRSRKRAEKTKAKFEDLFAKLNECQESDWDKSAKELCQCVYGVALCANKQDDYATERHWQINLLALGWHGTLEFRAFPATTDPKRAMKWVTFILRFVETFKSMDPFDGGRVSLGRLAALQRTSTLDELSDQMGAGNFDLHYWKERSWMSGQYACHAH